MSEKLERVRDFGELREGMVTVVKDCDCDRARCRAMLMPFMGRCTCCESKCFDTMPRCRGEDDSGVCAGMIAKGYVWRVVDGLESPQTTERAKERVRR